MAGDTTVVEIDGRRLSLSSLDKVLYPVSGTTKAEVLSYVAQVGPALLAQLRDRPVTRVRWPHGTGGDHFFEKNVPGGTPSWVRRTTLVSHSSRRREERVTYPLLDDVAALTWVTNLNALELHVPQWRVDADGDPVTPDRLVVDLDPGEGAGLEECARVALLVRDVLAELAPGPLVPVTSGSKGMQLYAASPTGDLDANREIAEQLAELLATRHPDLVVSRMTKTLRRDRVLLDWSQNTRAKTTICPYSLRGRGGSPTVAAPRGWEEVEAGAAGRHFAQLGPDDVLGRLGRDGDLMRPLAGRGPGAPAGP